MTLRWYGLLINPEPWAMGQVSVGKKNGRVFPIVGKNSQLAAYQEAVRESMEEQWPDKITGDVRLVFLFWRNLAVYTSQTGRQVQKHKPDTTNLQKATEDALQGILFKNDNQVVDVRSHMVEVGTETVGRVVIGIEEHNPVEQHPWLQYDSTLIKKFSTVPSDTEVTDAIEKRLTWGATDGSDSI